jgi:hypothetical protein
MLPVVGEVLTVDAMVAVDGQYVAVVAVHG